MLRILWVSLPVHALLPAAALLPVPTTWLAGAFLTLHLGFPVVLVVTWRWWRGQALEVAVVVLLDHLVTLGLLGLLS